MKAARPRILLTNDDGYHADGIVALEKCLSEIGDVYDGAVRFGEMGLSRLGQKEWGSHVQCKHGVPLGRRNRADGCTLHDRCGIDEEI